MPKNGSTAEKTAARRVQTTLGVPYTRALNLVRDAKIASITWTEAADRVLAEHARPGTFPEGAQ